MIAKINDYGEYCYYPPPKISPTFFSITLNYSDFLFLNEWDERGYIWRVFHWLKARGKITPKESEVLK